MIKSPVSTPGKGIPGDSTPFIMNVDVHGSDPTPIIGSVEGHGCPTKHEKLCSPQTRLSFQSLVILTNP